MNYKNFILILFVFVSTLNVSCIYEKQKDITELEKYKPIDSDLQQKIEELDNIFFTAYNNCNIEQQALLISEDIEFFHDKGGLSTSKAEIIESIKNNICGKVTRELIPGSIEVYPINNYGAVEMGYHKFFNNQEPDAVSKPSKFITIWKNENEDWKMTRIISLH